MAAECRNCGHPQTQHKAGRQGCGNCDLGCGRFEPDDAAQLVVEPVPAEKLTAVDELGENPFCCEGEPAFGDPNGLHTFDCPVYQKNAAAMIERNRPAQPVRAADLDFAWPDPGPARPTPHLNAVKARLAAVEREMAAVDKAAGRDIAKPDEPLVDRVADLLRGRTEATERALELAAELKGARDEIERLRAAADGYLQARPAAPDVVELYGYDAWQCDVCGSRYRPNHNHPCGPLKPVRVSIQPRSAS